MKRAISALYTQWITRLVKPRHKDMFPEAFSFPESEKSAARDNKDPNSDLQYFCLVPKPDDKYGIVCLNQYRYAAVLEGGYVLHGCIARANIDVESICVADMSYIQSLIGLDLTADMLVNCLESLLAPLIESKAIANVKLYSRVASYDTRWIDTAITRLLIYTDSWSYAALRVFIERNWLKKALVHLWLGKTVENVRNDIIDAFGEDEQDIIDAWLATLSVPPMPHKLNIAHINTDMKDSCTIVSVRALGGSWFCSLGPFPRNWTHRAGVIS